jgi:hypothetical protein
MKRARSKRGRREGSYGRTEKDERQGRCLGEAHRFAYSDASFVSSVLSGQASCADSRIGIMFYALRPMNHDRTRRVVFRLVPLASHSHLARLLLPSKAFRDPCVSRQHIQRDVNSSCVPRSYLMRRVCPFNSHAPQGHKTGRLVININVVSMTIAQTDSNEKEDNGEQA